MTKALIWDFDGTLGYRQGGMYSAALLEIIQQNVPGAVVTLDQIRPYLQSGFPWQSPEQPHLEIQKDDQWWERLYPVFERALAGVGLAGPQVVALSRMVRPVYTDLAHWALFEDVLPALDSLSASGWKHVLLSNHAPELERILQHLNLLPRLARVFNSARLGYEKPNPVAFHTVLTYLAGAERIWMIGDSLQADIVGANQVGLPAILVRKPQPGVLYFCQTLFQVAEILNQEVE